MKLKNHLQQTGLFSTALLALFSCSQTESKKEKPNVLLIVVDDLGWSDLACYGNKIVETPNVDLLAKEGIRFTNAYATCPVCSPTRASILTGKYPTSVNLTDYIPGKQFKGVMPNQKFIVPEFNQQLPLKEITIAEQLKSVGYKTIHIGKWHLGDKGFLPNDQGFDINIAGGHYGHPGSYYFPYVGKNAKVENMDRSKSDSLYLTDRITNEAIQQIEMNKDSTFFIYLPFFTVHWPIEGRPDLVDYYKKKSDTIQNPGYLAMIHCMDESIGRIMSVLEKHNLMENTLIIFTSDNGGLKNPGMADNSPLKMGKGTAYEGGVRVPTIIKWKNHIIKPGRENDNLISSIDFFPLIMDAVGIENATSDGKSLMPILNNENSFDRTDLYWHYPHYHRTPPFGAIRHNNYKLIAYLEDEKIELYDLTNDIGEQNNLADSLPEKSEELLELLYAWRTKTGARMPTLNPDWDSTQVYRLGD